MTTNFSERMPGMYYGVQVVCLRWVYRMQDAFHVIRGCGKEFHYYILYYNDNDQWVRPLEVRCPHCRQLMWPTSGS